jgi:hypothetical protein
LTLILSEEEREHLLRLLEEALPQILVEAHRTQTPDYRQHVERKEAILRGLADKLRRP